MFSTKVFQRLLELHAAFDANTSTSHTLQAGKLHRLNFANDPSILLALFQMPT